MLIEIRAKFNCDHCGKEFSVEIDSGSKPSHEWSIYEDALKGSLKYEGPKSRNGRLGSTSFQQNKHLCGVCTEEYDANSTEEVGL